MKKVITGVLISAGLMATQAMAESDLYVGLDLFGSNNSFDFNIPGYGSANTDVDSKGLKLKFGTVLDNGWRMQGYWVHETFDETLFDPTNDKLNEIGLDVIKGFEATSELSPFIQGGIGIGWMELDQSYYTDDSIAEYSLKVGAGLMYEFTPMIEGLLGVDLQYRKWQDIDLGAATLETDDTSSRFYLGVNIHL